MKPGAFLTRHRNLFLLTLLLITLAVGSLSAQERLRTAAPTVSIPVAATGGSVLSPVERARQERDASEQTDIAALKALCSQTTIDQQTREDAADLLQRRISHREAQLALETALCTSSLAPCIAVVTEDSLTIVSEKSEITERDTALVLRLADAHTDVPLSGVRLLTAE